MTYILLQKNKQHAGRSDYLLFCEAEYLIIIWGIFCKCLSEWQYMIWFYIVDLHYVVRVLPRRIYIVVVTVRTKMSHKRFSTYMAFDVFFFSPLKLFLSTFSLCLCLSLSLSLALFLYLSICTSFSTCTIFFNHSIKLYNIFNLFFVGFQFEFYKNFCLNRWTNFILFTL